MKKKAFTLLELIAVLSIISILLIIPSLKLGIIDRLGFKNELETFKNDYSYARQRALASGEYYYLYFIGDSYYLSRSYENKPSSPDLKRDLKYMEADVNPKIDFKDNGHVSVDRKINNGSYRIEFHSKGDNSKKKTLVIAAIGGNISEK